MYSAGKMFLSEYQKKRQIVAIQERFPDLGNIRSVPLNSYTDIFQQIDIKADNDFSGDTVNFQLKCRSSAEDDVCFKVKELFGAEKNSIGFAYTVNDSKKYYVFPPEFTKANFFVFTRGSNTPLIMNTTAIVRAFYRYGEFGSEELTIKEANDKIDCSYRLLFINPFFMVKLLTLDYLTILGGSELITAYGDMAIKQLLPAEEIKH